MPTPRSIDGILDFPTTADGDLGMYANMPSACLQDGMGLFHEAVYAKIPPAQRREKFSNAHFFLVTATKQQEVLGRGGKELGEGLVDGCGACPPRRGLVSDPLRMDRRYQQYVASRGPGGLECLLTPWEQHDASAGILEVKLKPMSLPTLPMRRNHVVFPIHNVSGNVGPIKCVMGGTLHPECEVPMDVRGETREEQMPFVYTTSMCESWSRHYPLHGKDNTIPPNIYNGCIVGYHEPSCPGKVYLLVQEPLSSGGFQDKLICMEVTFLNYYTITPTWTTIFTSTTLQGESTEPTQPFHPTERFITVDSHNNKDRIHVTQVTANGVAVYEWTVGDAAEWKLRGNISNETTVPTIRGVAGSPLYNTNNSLSKIRIFAQCLDEDEMWFMPRTDDSQGGFRARLGNVLRATAAGSNPLFETCPLSLKTLDVEPLVTTTNTNADTDYSQLHAPRDVEAALILQDEIYDRPVDEPVAFTSPAGSWTFSAQSSSDQLAPCPERSSTGATWGATKSSTMGDRMFSGGSSDNQQPMDIFYQLVEEVDNRTTLNLKARTLQRQLLTTANGIMDVASATGAPLHICAGMTSEQFQHRVIRSMRQFLRCMSKGGYIFDDMDDPMPDATSKQRPSHTRGVNANFVQPSALTHRWAISVRDASSGRSQHKSGHGDLEQTEVLMLGIAQKSEARQRGMLASRCPEASNSSSLKSITAQWISTASR